MNIPLIELWNFPFHLLISLPFSSSLKRSKYEASFFVKYFFTKLYLSCSTSFSYLSLEKVQAYVELSLLLKILENDKSTSDSLNI